MTDLIIQSPELPEILREFRDALTIVTPDQSLSKADQFFMGISEGMIRLAYHLHENGYQVTQIYMRKPELSEGSDGEKTWSALGKIHFGEILEKQISVSPHYTATPSIFRRDIKKASLSYEYGTVSRSFYVNDPADPKSWKVTYGNKIRQGGIGFIDQVLRFIDEAPSHETVFQGFEVKVPTRVNRERHEGPNR